MLLRSSGFMDLRKILSMCRSSRVHGMQHLKVMNGWWSNTYYDHVKWADGLNELQITETMANECAKGGEGRDLDLMLYSGTMTLNSVYYEE